MQAKNAGHGSMPGLVWANEDPLVIVRVNFLALKDGRPAPRQLLQNLLLVGVLICHRGRIHRVVERT